MSIVIESIAPADHADVLRLNEASLPHVSAIDGDDLAWFCEHGSAVLVARLNSEFAGFLIGLRPGTCYASMNYRWFCDRYADFAYVDRVAVVESARRCGVAESLYARFAASNADAQVMTCEVNVKPSNEGSMRFHERSGFTIVGHQDTEGGKKRVALMEKKL